MYIIVDDVTSKRASIYTKDYITKEEAIATAKRDWDSMSDLEKNIRDAFYVMESEDAESLDGNIILRLKGER